MYARHASGLGAGAVGFSFAARVLPGSGHAGVDLAVAFPPPPSNFVRLPEKTESSPASESEATPWLRYFEGGDPGPRALFREVNKAQSVLPKYKITPWIAPKFLERLVVVPSRPLPNYFILEQLFPEHAIEHDFQVVRCGRGAVKVKRGGWLEDAVQLQRGDLPSSSGTPSCRVLAKRVAQGAHHVGHTSVCLI